jgi:hypothetical protein
MPVILAQPTHAEHQRPFIAFRSEAQIDPKHRAITAHTADGLHELLGDFVVRKLLRDEGRVDWVLMDKEQVQV